MTLKLLMLIPLLFSLLCTCQAKSHISEYFKQVQKQCRPQCDVPLEKLAAEFNGNPENCMNECISSECYFRVFAPNPPAPGLKDIQLQRDFKDCVVKYALDLGYTNHPKDQPESPYETPEYIDKQKKIERRLFQEEVKMKAKEIKLENLKRKDGLGLNPEKINVKDGM